ncbi:hypothetical protein N9B71_05695, partial [Pirellulales bacterium]|nr:hypothetical protein [Pirellulales bacterium]
MSRESNRQKFVELAERRVTKAMKAIRLVGNLSNKANYQYTDDDVEKIFKALRRSLDDMKARFSSKVEKDANVFRL